jgi:hypothetical protein
MLCKICNKSYKNLKNHCLKKKDKSHIELVFNENNVNDWVACQVQSCFYRASRIDFHLKKIHKILKNDYERIYGQTTSKNLKEKSIEIGRHANDNRDLTGKNNPFYGKNHTKHTKQKISKTEKTNNALLEIHFNKNRKHKQETKEKMSKSRIGDKNPMYGMRRSFLLKRS